MNLKKVLIFLLVLILLIIGNCKKIVDPIIGTDNRIVFDESKVRTVAIGNQTWMAENLKINVDRGGNLMNCRSIHEDPANDEVYGKVYTYQQALDGCPSGWHLPSIEEWHVLFDSLGGIAVAGGKMKTIEYWDPPNAGATNSSGFSAVPAGPHDGFGWACHFWSSTEDGGNAYMPSLMNSREDVYILYDQLKTSTISVRYIRD